MTDQREALREAIERLPRFAIDIENIERPLTPDPRGLLVRLNDVRALAALPSTPQPTVISATGGNWPSTPQPEGLDVERWYEAVSDALAASTEGTDYAEAPVPSDEPKSPYVLRLTHELLSRLHPAEYARLAPPPPDHVHTPTSKPGDTNAWCSTCGYFPLPLSAPPPPEPTEVSADD